MNKNKKIILITVISILILVLIAGIIYFIVANTEKEDPNTILQGSTSKTSQLMSQLTEKQNFSFETTVDEKNKVFYAKKEDMAYIDTYYNGRESKILVKDGNSYLLVDEYEKFYTYNNNQTDLNKIQNELEKLNEMTYTSGSEEIDNKKYKYEEFETITDFLIKDINSKEKTGKTRFYYKGDTLVYIKTIIGDKEELLKVNVSYDVKDNLFEIPSNYQEG